MAKKRKYDRETLAPVVVECTSVAQVCRAFGVSDRGSMNTLMKRRIQDAGLDTSHFLGRAANSGGSHKGGFRQLSADEILVYGRLAPAKEKVSKLRRALEEIGVKKLCAECGQGEIWNGKPLTHHIDHINGDPLGNQRGNLRYLCPNCHTQTETYAWKNIGSVVE